MFGTPPIFFNAITGITTPADAYFFDGSSTSYMTTSYPLDGITDVTFMVQGTIDAANSTWTTMLGAHSGSTDLICGRNASNELAFQMYNGSQIIGFEQAWTNDFEEHIFGFRFDSAVGTSIWVDGTEIGTDAGKTFSGMSVSKNLQIARRGTNDSIMVGEMKVIKLWEEALSDASMLSHGSNINYASSDLNLNFQKTETTWTDEELAYDATDAGKVDLAYDTLVMTSKSSSAAWQFVDWEGDTIYDYRMLWTCTGAVTTSWEGIGPPLFDFSSNTGNALITITVTYPRIDLLSLVDLYDGSGDSVETIDLSKATGMVDFAPRYSNLVNDYDLLLPAALNSLTDFKARGNQQLSGFNTKTDLIAPNLTFFQADNTFIIFDASDFPLLDDVRFDGNNVGCPGMSVEVVDKVMLDIAGHSVSSGTLVMDDANWPLTPRSKGHWDTLTARSWTLDMNRPNGIVFTTTSTSATYAPTGSQNASTQTLKWHVTGPGMTPATYDSNNPTMDMSDNTGTATITIASSDDLATHTVLWLWYSNLVDIDFEDAVELKDLSIRGNNTTFTPTTVDLSPLVDLEWFQADVMGFTSLDISNNPLIDEIRVHSNALPAAAQDTIMEILNSNGVENGTLYIGTQASSITPTESSYRDYIELKDKGWTIDITVANTVDVDTYFVSQTSKREPTARITGIHMRDDGKFMSTVTDSPDYMHSYDLTIPFAFRSRSDSSLYDIGTEVGTGANMQGLRWKPDGTRFFIADLGFDGIQQYTCTTAWDITGTVTHNGEYNPAETVNELTVEFNKDGDVMWIGAFNDEQIHEYDLTTAWDVTGTVTHVASHTIGGTPAGAQHVHYMGWINEGKNLFLRMPEDNGIMDFSYYSCSTAYDLSSTVTLVGSKDFDSIVWTGMNAMYYVDKERLAVLGDYQRDIHQILRSTEDDVWQTTTGYTYIWPKVHDMYTVVLNKTMSDFTDVSCAVRFRLGAVNKADGLWNALTGSTSHNFMRFDYRSRVTTGESDLYVQWSDGNNTISGYFYDIPSLTDGKFHTIAYSMNTSTGIVRLYLDGTFLGSKTGTFGGWSVIGDSDLNYEVIQIGDRARGSGSYGGQISHVQYYASTMTDQQLIDVTIDIDDYPTSPAPVVRLGDKRGKYFWYDLSGNDHHAGVEAVELIPEGQFTTRGDELLIIDGWVLDANGTTLGSGKVDLLTSAANQYPLSTNDYTMFGEWAWLEMVYTISNYSTGEIRTCVDTISNDTSASHSANGTFTDILYAHTGHDGQVKWANGATAVTSMDITDIVGTILGYSIITVATCTHPFRPTAVVGTEWSVITGCTLSVSSDLPGATGNSLKGTATGAAASQGFKNTKTIVTSTDYIVSYWAKKEGTANEQVAQSWTGFTTSPTQTITSTWTKYTHSLTSNATTAVCNFYNTTATTTSGEGVFISEFNIELDT